jgi:hypothetical protein
MPETKIEERLAALELEVAELKRKLPPVEPVVQPWWEITVGTLQTIQPSRKRWN